jgi:GTP-binding protein
MKFIDRVKVYIRSGKGGAGSSSFRREKYVPRGGPDGGDGGKGGDIIIRVNPHLNNLTHIFYGPHFFAEDGFPGRSRQKSGKGGEDKVIEVPVGTMIYLLYKKDRNEEFRLDPEEKQLVRDCVKPGEDFVLCKGGDGGRGNVHFKSSVNQAPERHEPGWPNEEGEYFFELKSIADVGLVGYPNAGKSSMLTSMSSARPKIASYPFTTLTPMIGVIEYGNKDRIQMADIPGIIEGAHEGKGLGHEFLRHIERCPLLAFILDMGGVDGRSPTEDFMSLRTEVKLFNKDLAKRPYIVVANKMDVEGSEENLKIFKQRFPKEKIYAISITEKQGVEELKDLLLKKITKLREDTEDEE